MKIGDLVRNIHTMRGGEADEHGIIVGLSVELWVEADFPDGHVKVMWFPNGLVEYMTWMNTDDLEVLA